MTVSPELPIQRPSPLFFFASGLCLLIVVLILAGGLVTSHEAGLAVPDWPLSYGQLMPPMVGNIFWEHGHRVIAAAVGFLTLFLAISLQVWEPRSWVKKLGWIAAVTVLIQALLGGLTVKMMLPPAVSVSHACLAQTFFCLMLALAYFLSPRFLSNRQYVQVHTKPGLFFLTFGFVYLQLILGAALRHTHQYPALHIINAFFVLIHILLTCSRISRFYAPDPLLRRLGGLLSILTLVQILLGAGAFIFRHVLEQGYAPTKTAVFFTSAHQTVGALILGSIALICLAVHRR